MEGILEGVRAMLLEGVPRERHGSGGLRGRDAVITMMTRASPFS